MKIKTKILRSLLGILMIVMAIATFVWWENMGRKTFTMESVIIANKTIEKGRVVKENDFKEIKIAREVLINGAITTETFERITGSIAKQYVPEGSQITKKMFVRADKILKPGQFIFALKEEWIDSRSSSLRKGDVIDVFDKMGNLYMGTFQVAYVKDDNEQEVVGTEENRNEEILRRDFSSATITHVEIIATLGEYIALRQIVELQQTQFLLVQKGGI